MKEKILNISRFIIAIPCGILASTLIGYILRFFSFLNGGDNYASYLLLIITPNLLSGFIYLLVATYIAPLKTKKIILYLTSSIVIVGGARNLYSSLIIYENYRLFAEYLFFTVGSISFLFYYFTNSSDYKEIS